MEQLEEALRKIENSKYVDKCALFKSNGEPIVSHVDEETTRLVKPFFGLDMTIERTILEKRWSRIIIARLRDYVFVLSSRKAPNLGLLYLEFNKALKMLRESIESITIPSANHETVTISNVRTVEEEEHAVEKEEQEAWDSLINIEKPSEEYPSLITRKTVFSKTTTVEELIDSPVLKDLKSLNDWVLVFYMLLDGEKTVEQVAQEMGQSIDNVTKLSYALFKLGKVKIKST